MRPLVSIILPAYNGAHTIARSIESVLAQTFSDWELIILNDASTDGIAAAVEPFLGNPKIRYLSNETNLGLQRTLNKAVGLSGGWYIARIDQDDTWMDADKLERQIAWLEADSERVLIGADAVLSDVKGKRIGAYAMPKTDADIRARMLSRNCFLHASVVMRRSAFDQAGGYSEAKEAYCIEDYDLWLRLGLIGKMANSGARINITVHGQSMTAKNRTTQAYNIWKLLPRYEGKYPHYLQGRMTSFLRLQYFRLMKAVPWLAKATYRLQVIYKNL